MPATGGAKNLVAEEANGLSLGSNQLGFPIGRSKLRSLVDDDSWPTVPPADKQVAVAVVVPVANKWCRLITQRHDGRTRDSLAKETEVMPRGFAMLLSQALVGVLHKQGHRLEHIASDQDPGVWTVVDGGQDSRLKDLPVHAR